MHKPAQVELQLDRPQLPYSEIFGPITAGGSPAHYRRRQPEPNTPYTEKAPTAITGKGTTGFVLGTMFMWLGLLTFLRRSHGVLPLLDGVEATIRFVSDSTTRKTQPLYTFIRHSLLK